jgi:SAM-dependent methyltransferase
VDRYDTTSLTATSHGSRVHRDYAAHFFRWGFAARLIRTGDEVLDVGCGEDYPFVKTLIGGFPTGLPARYVGVDLNALPRPPHRGWATFSGSFDFIERYRELGTFSVVLCLEVIEHVPRVAGDRLLAGLRACLAPGGRLLLSTPVFNGRAAKNHVHEYEIEELREAILAADLRVERRYGTFASYQAIKRVASPEELDTLDRLREFYSNEVTACFLAPLYPDASRNNLWVLRRP